MSRRNDAEKAQSAQGFVAGLIAAAVMATGVGVALTVLAAPLRALRLGPLIRFLTGVHVDEARYPRKFARQAKWGMGIGYGLIMGASALNWAVEQWDRISGETL